MPFLQECVSIVTHSCSNVSGYWSASCGRTGFFVMTCLPVFGSAGYTSIYRGRFLAVEQCAHPATEREQGNRALSQVFPVLFYPYLAPAAQREFRG
jgi:hypothetical protein